MSPLVLTIISDPLFIRDTVNTPKILESFTMEQIKQFVVSIGEAKSDKEFNGWLKEFVQNSIYVVVVNEKSNIEGFITAKNNQEVLMDGEAKIEPLVVTGFYSNPRDIEKEQGMMEVLIEVAVRTGHQELKIPNSTKLMRSFTDCLIARPEFREVEVISSDSSDFDCFDLTSFQQVA
ncbi:hypothetical protein JCM30760_26260 [Thiomicrorhabdus hydrogeniphila]